MRGVTRESNPGCMGTSEVRRVIEKGIAVKIIRDEQLL